MPALRMGELLKHITCTQPNGYGRPCCCLGHQVFHLFSQELLSWSYIAAWYTGGVKNLVWEPYHLPPCQIERLYSALTLAIVIPHVIVMPHKFGVLVFALLNL